MIPHGLFKRLAPAILLLSIGTASGAAVAVPGGVTTVGGVPIDVQPSALIGFDSSTALPCVVGKTAACLLSTNGGSAPFAVTGNTTITGGVTTSRVALPNTDAALLIQNTGTADAYVKLGSSSVTAATTDTLVAAGTKIVLAAGTSTNLAAITASGSSLLTITQGTGTPAGWGGGGGLSGALGAGSAVIGKVNIVDSGGVDITDPTRHAAKTYDADVVAAIAAAAAPAASGATGSAVPANAELDGINVGGTLRAATGVNPSGSIYAKQVDIASLGGLSALNLSSTSSTLANTPAFGLMLSNGSTLAAAHDGTTGSSSGAGALATTVQPNNNSFNAIAIANTATSALVAKGSGGNIYGYGGLQNASSNGYLLILNATAAPSGGASLTIGTASGNVLKCIKWAQDTSLDVGKTIPNSTANGITLLDSSSCTTYTAVTPVAMWAEVK